MLGAWQVCVAIDRTVRFRRCSSPPTQDPNLLARGTWGLGQSLQATQEAFVFTSQKSNYEAIEIMGLYWHFVDLVWVFIFAFFYLW